MSQEAPTTRHAPVIPRHGTEAPVQAVSATPPHRPRARGSWARAKALGAVLAVSVLITGAALPGISDAEPEQVEAAATVDAQSHTAGENIRVEVLPRGDFSATTEKEIAASRAQAIAAAVASGRPLSTAVNLPTAQQVLMPLPSGTYSVSDGFGASRPGRSHMGQDLAASVGTPIYAAVEGCVSLSTESNSGYGVSIQVESLFNGETVSTLYSHLNGGTRAVEVGDCVAPGQYLGDVGSTGYVFGSCLHFEVDINGRPIDPMPWLRKNVQ